MTSKCDKTSFLPSQSLSKMTLRTCTYAHISLQWKLMLMFLQQPQQALLLLLLCSCSNLITSRQVSCDKCAAHVCKSSCFEQWDRKSWPKGWPHWGQEVGQELYGLIAHSKTLFNKKVEKMRPKDLPAWFLVHITLVHLMEALLSA